MLRVDVTPKRTENYRVDDCDYVSFINDGTYGIPGGGDPGHSRGGTLLQKIHDGSKVLFINTTTVERLTIEDIDA